MKYIDIELSEIDVIIILNSLSYFRNEITWHDNIKQKERIAMYFNFKDEYVEQYNKLDNLHKRISLEANSKLYNINNEYFFKGQREYLSNNKKFDFCYNKDLKENIIKIPLKNNKYFLRKFIDKFKNIV